MIPFNRPSLVGKELEYVADCVATGRTSGDGKYTFLCQEWLERTFDFNKVLLTTSCTDALEMAATLLDLQPGDEVILPSFAFVSLATAFSGKGATIKFADVDLNTCNISVESVQYQLSSKTKAIVIIHYAGVACEMEAIMDLCEKNNVELIEDVALGFDAYYKGKPLGTFGGLATFSFHETKNISSGEGGALVVNKKEWIEKAEIIRDKGTNRSKMRRGEVQKYEWLSPGSSHLPSDLTAAFLYGQLEKYKSIQQKRVALWQTYQTAFKLLEREEGVNLPFIPEYASPNGSSYHLICRTPQERDALIDYLLAKNIKAVFHYLPLHLSPYYLKSQKKDHLPHTEEIASKIVRMPLFYSLSLDVQKTIIDSVFQFYRQQ